MDRIAPIGFPDLVMATWLDFRTFSFWGTVDVPLFSHSKLNFLQRGDL